MGTGALFMELMKKIMRRRALVPAEIRALKWGVLRLLGLVDPPLHRIRRREEPTLEEEIVLDRALQFQRKVMEVHPEEGMSVARRYGRVEISFAAAAPSDGTTRILSEEEAKRLEVMSRKLHLGAHRLEGIEEMGRPFVGPERRMSWNSVADAVPTDTPENETDRKKE